MAHAFNPDFIEPDLVMTKDDRLIVLHDITLETTTDVETKFPKRMRKDGHWYAIDFTLKELKKLRVHERAKGNQAIFSTRFPYGTSSFEVPTFEEYIELIQGLNKSRNKDIGIYPEIKNPAFHQKAGKNILKATMEVLEKYGYERPDSLGKVYLQCFDPELLKEFRRHYPKSRIPTIQLIADDSWQESSHSYADMMTEKGLREVATYADGIGPWIPFVMKPNAKKKTFEKTGLVARAHKEGLLVHVYTFRKDRLPAIISQPKDLWDFLVEVVEVDGIFTDFPEGITE